MYGEATSLRRSAHSALVTYKKAWIFRARSSLAEAGSQEDLQDFNNTVLSARRNAAQRPELARTHPPRRRYARGNQKRASLYMVTVRVRPGALEYEDQVKW
jgi:hypothetical protein